MHMQSTYKVIAVYLWEYMQALAGVSFLFEQGVRGGSYSEVINYTVILLSFTSFTL